MLTGCQVTIPYLGWPFGRVLDLAVGRRTRNRFRLAFPTGAPAGKTVLSASLHAIAYHGQSPKQRGDHPRGYDRLALTSQQRAARSPMAMSPGAWWRFIARTASWPRPRGVSPAEHHPRR